MKLIRREVVLTTLVEEYQDSNGNWLLYEDGEIVMSSLNTIEHEWYSSGELITSKLD
jgi:hypothetical protein